MTVSIPPAAVLIFGGLVLPLLPARLRAPALLALPLVTLALVWQVPDGVALEARFLGYTVGAGVLTTLLAVVWPDARMIGHLGVWPVANAMIVAWAMLYPDRQVNIWGVLPLTGKTLALVVLGGTVLGQCMQRHRHQEFIRFLNAIERAVPAGKLVHVVLDNYATHKPSKVLRWLGRHPRFVFHFTPTSCSWLNAVETFFSRLTRRRLKRGVFRSIVELQAAINRYVDQHNHDPKPFIWTKPADQILAKVNRLNASVH